MIPDIGMIVAAYVVFRCLAELAKMGPGGSNYDLHPVAAVGLGICALGTIAIAILCGMDLFAQGTDRTRDLLSP